MLAIHLQILGVIWCLLAGLNVFVLPRYFGWKKELLNVSLLTRQVFQVHLFFIVIVLLMMGVLSLGYSQLLIAPSPLARLVLFGLFVFWTIRLLVQWFVYDPELWRGSRRNTTAHVAFSLLWLYASAIYGWAWWAQMTPTTM